LFTEVLKQNLNLQRFSILYTCGNYSGILSRLSCRFTDLEIRRAFMVFLAHDPPGGGTSPPRS
jgi:hypothetical protein